MDENEASRVNGSTVTAGSYSDDYYMNNMPASYNVNRYAQADPLSRMRNGQNRVRGDTMVGGNRSRTAGNVGQEMYPMDLSEMDSEEYSPGQSDSRGFGDYMLMNTASEMSAYQKMQEKQIEHIGQDTDKILEKLGGENMTGNFDSGMLAGMLSQRGVDPGLIAMLNNRSGFGNGDGGLLFLLFLVILMGNGGWNNGFGGGMNGVDRTVINEGNFNQLMTAITGQGQAQTAAVQALANNLNTDTSAITSALAGVDKAIAVNQGSIVSAIQSCCCNIRTELQSTANATQLAILNGNNGIQTALNSGFNGLQNQASQIAFAQQNQDSQNTQNIINAISAQSTMIQDQFCQIRNREDAKTIQDLRDKLAEERDQANTRLLLTAMANMNELRGTVQGTLDTTAGTFTGTTVGNLS